MGKVHLEQKEIAVLALLFCACSTFPEPDPWPADAPPEGETVAWIDGRVVTYGEVCRYLRSKDPAAFQGSLEAYVLELATLAEAEPLGIAVSDAVLTRHTRRRLREWEEQLRTAAQEQGAEPVDPAAWLERVAGMSLADFHASVRRHTGVELLQDRLLRYEQVTSRRIEVSMLVVQEREEAERLAALARAGEDFAALAREHSDHPTAEEGGRFDFPLLEADVNDASVRAALFSTPAGGVAGPFATRGGGATWHQVYRIESVTPARRVPWADVAAEVEADLEKRPVPMGEYERWRRRILLRHGFAATPAPGEAG